jgi:hypothetical protein
MAGVVWHGGAVLVELPSRVLRAMAASRHGPQIQRGPPTSARCGSGAPPTTPPPNQPPNHQGTWPMERLLAGSRRRGSKPVWDQNETWMEFRDLVGRFASSGTDMTQRNKFKDRQCILLKLYYVPPPLENLHHDPRQNYLYVFHFFSRERMCRGEGC